jgi:predicted enzyme related to lactoylglutathione lyase
MGKRTSYEPGTFSYVELHTTDTEDSKRFYGDLFGWEPEEVPIPEDAGGGTYTLLKLGGETAAALTLQAPQQRDAGVPANWFSYVTVADADQAAARADELGGAVHAGPFDVMDAGRMAVVADPTGAMLGVWQAGSSIGATLVNDPGFLTMNELSTNDVVRAQEFYAALFGWAFEQLDTGEMPPYWAVRHAGAANGLNGGMRELAPQQTEAGIPPHWMPYFTVESTDATVTAATDRGGGVLAPAFDIPSGRIAVLHDPQGAAFGVFEGEVDD